MDHRIGSLHLNYRLRNGSTDAALTPGFDRALHSGLADAVSARLAAMFGDDPAVIVVRELKSAVALDTQDILLDSRVVDGVCAASVDALGQMLARERSPELVVRFADQVEFVGAFLVDLVQGCAWDHWYYGAFQRYRRAHVGDTIRAVLAESGVDAARVLAWLSRRRKLDAVMEFIAPDEALALVAPGRTRQTSEDTAGIEVLAAAAIDLLAALGWGEFVTSREEILARFLATRPTAARWTERRSLSAWVLAFIRFVATTASGLRPRIAPGLPDAARELLAGRLDWLDGSWLSDELATLTTAPIAEHLNAPDRPLLTMRQRRVLESLTRRVRTGDVSIPVGTSETECTVRLIAAATEDLAADETLDRTVLAAIEAIARAAAGTRGQLDSDAFGVSRDDVLPTGDNTLPPDFVSSSAPSATELTRYGNVASDLLRALRATRSASEAALQATQAGGLFLLLRALIDTRLPALAHRAGVPLAPLLGAIAVKLFEPRVPFDAATSLWADTEAPDYASLESTVDQVQALQGALLDVLIAQHVLGEADACERIDTDARLPGTVLPCSSAIDGAIARIAALLVHAWSHWLRGVAHSSVSFLLDQCLRRAARAHISDTLVAIELDPAPLDVVLHMAGYFARIDAVPWLGNRSVTFTVGRAAEA